MVNFFVCSKYFCLNVKIVFQVCPSLKVCPGVLVAVEYKDKPTCPLCLLAFEEALHKVQDNRSEVSIIYDVKI